MTGFRIDPVVALTWDVAELVNRHFDMMRMQSPQESCHVMTAEDLFAARSIVFALRKDSDMLGIAALKPLDDMHGELKSMHTKAEARGMGVGAALVQHILQQARGLSMDRISLETGSAEAFAPARRLYERQGFSYCAPFAGYSEDSLSVFMTRTV
jgi:putative acetyltransferase